MDRQGIPYILFMDSFSLPVKTLYFKIFSLTFKARIKSDILWKHACHLPWLLSWGWGMGCCCSVTKLCLTLRDPMDCSTLGSPGLLYLQEFAWTHVHWADDAIQPPHPLSPPFPPAFNLSQPQGLFQWVSSSCHVAKVLELQLQQQSFQWIFRVDFL